ncbi:Cys-tRNA(Pro) deacylase [Corynebacterium gerontici]|uniref:Cys-tRNA(Pro)/Cys-tRNA(Cys) deacylase n=1 Tax=Corynebacterium gerontici TaxID=2079234 RepID=A0A3G6IZE4_9CORY|nr:Cys-tRNA(Pro) deacylase [Corynebacterium gerontici]AZA10883.1 Cys-tRNA(Pro)/Cys-tRNA(Cys) deacylase YbaK [Corynebacterium gerontici]
MTKQQAAPTPAIQALKDVGVNFRVHTFEPGEDHFGKHAAEALQVPSEQVFKTLVMQLATRQGSQLAVACVPVSAKLNLKAAAKALGAKKAEMADPHHASVSTGYVPGGISPLGQKRKLNTVIDASAFEHQQIFVSGGRRGLDIALSPTDLQALLDARVADIQA